MRRSVYLLAAVALLIIAPGRAGAGEGYGWRGQDHGAYGHGGPDHRYGDHGPRRRYHGRHHRAVMSAPEPVYGGGTMLVELCDPYLPPGVLYNVPGPPPVYAHTTVIRAKY